uniref:Uncharacterized protein n=1 Tax=Lactuca sativa TaxID=4236 RepID=A0A9R1WY43_LACSA|nr:hypothetical protein LSAT_V11C800438420 [Lactuca sativa]
MLFVDNYLRRCFFSRAQSHLKWLWHKSNKSHNVDEIISLIKSWEVLYDHKVGKLRSDLGTKFRNSSLEDFCSISGISQNFSVVITP